MIRFSDADHSDEHVATVKGVSTSGIVDGLPQTDDLLGYLTLAPLIDTKAGKGGALQWSFAAPDSTFDYLGASEKATLTYAVEIDDGKGGNVVQNVSVTIMGRNDAPSIAPLTFSTMLGSPLTISLESLLAGTADADGDPLQILSVLGAKNGGLVRDADGSVVFTPASLASGSFSYVVSDGHGGNVKATAIVEVQPQFSTSGQDTFHAMAPSTAGQLFAGSPDAPIEPLGGLEAALLGVNDVSPSRA